MKTLTLILLAGVVASFSAHAAPVDWSQLPPAATNAGVTFANDIAPIFKASCVRCHGAQRPKAGLRLDTLPGVLDGTTDGAILKAGDSANSLLVKAISQLDPKTAMPPKPRAPRGPGGEMGRPPGTNAVTMGDRPDGPPRMTGTNASGTNAPGQRPRSFGPPAKPLTAEQVGLVRAWIDQGAK